VNVGTSMKSASSVVSMPMVEKTSLQLNIRVI
jgi:hypothetical protein